uniref:protein-glutamine gamma-glutamyltransferase E-like n=1 Tax=Euleptes europaea TaxID=460621 RepID=UPI002540691F|nr:protein-glutamine gamma-glutamyltransferase E-like [Euleptes europaea]
MQAGKGAPSLVTEAAAGGRSACSESCLTSSPRLLPALNLANIDLKWKENTLAHHTDQYSTKELVVRRGQPFAITLTYRGRKPSGNLMFIMETGANPALQAKTRVAFAVTQTPSSGTWSAVQTSAGASTMTVSISSPDNAIIGRYYLSMTTGSGSSVPAASLGTVVLLFNPWLRGDDVFMANNAERKEYVLSEFGLYFTGSVDHITHSGWNFGQFQKGILNICLAMLDRSRSFMQDPHSDLARRNDPKHVARVMSAMVNSNDDQGVLFGKWSGDFSDGEKPSTWSGSVDILRRWKSSGFRPVKYSQCWVFAGVLTTVLRCLGMPTRIITNFNSAHDTKKSLTVDVYVDAEGNPLKNKGDTIWNFHVWNESWFLRPDLGPAFDGWQILDATPQERSSGIFQCGPASLTAVKEGSVELQYDVPFVFAEVNADRINWTYNPSTGETKRLYTDTKDIGQYTSTKAVGSYDRVDVTSSYKYHEGSAQERTVFEKARAKLNLNTMSSTAAMPLPPKPSVSGKFKVEHTPEVGKDVYLALKLTNHASEPKTVEVHMTAWTIIYTGMPIHEVWKNTQSVTLGPQEEKTFPVKITYKEYHQYLTTDNMIRATALCHIKEGEGDILVERIIVLDNPSLTIKVLGQPKVNELVAVEVLLTNPLVVEVKDCVLLVEGSDLLADKLKLDAPPLGAKRQATVQFALTPTKAGTKQLLVNFSCDKFHDVKAFQTLEVAQ